jgi:pyruvate formate lyase activating enzyme
MEVHEKSRRKFGLSPAAPKTQGGISCRLCFHECSMGPDDLGFCGLRANRGGKLAGPSAREASVSWYFDPLPTNCVADWVCPAGTGAGFPQYCHSRGPEYGYHNLAVFYESCTFNCLFCQNWGFKIRSSREEYRSLHEFINDIDDSVSCICYFGGDPSSQIASSILFSNEALRYRKGTILRICWETQGSMHPGFIEPMMKIAITSGGCVKFDLKTSDEKLGIALTGVSNRRMWGNFARAASFYDNRPAPPPLVASTLLVPGYVDGREVFSIASRIAMLNPEIPYSLLAFSPQFEMDDLPTTSRDQADECLMAAKKAGLKRIKIGNVHLLR